MAIDSFLIKLLIFLIPGIICFAIYEKLRYKKTENIYFYVVYSFLYAFICNELVYFIICDKNAEALMTQLFLENKYKVNLSHILFASGFGILLSVILSYISRYKLFFKFTNIIKATERNNEYDAWHEFGKKLKDKKATVTDYTQKKYYVGYATITSESEKKQEIILKDVDIYDFEYNFITYLDDMYLKLENKDFIIGVVNKDYFENNTIDNNK